MCGIKKIDKFDMIIVILLILTPILMYNKIIFTDKVLFTGDGLGYLASKELWKTSILNGEFPLWNRYIASGTPYVADIQNASFYPFNILILLFPVEMGFELYFVLHLSLAAIGMYYYIKMISNNRYIAISASLTIMFSNILILRFNHINIISFGLVFFAIF